METDHPEKETVIEHEHQLWLASEQYMRGEIAQSELEEIERLHIRDLKEAVLTLAKGRFNLARQ